MQNKVLVERQIDNSSSFPIFDLHFITALVLVYHQLMMTLLWMKKGKKGESIVAQRNPNTKVKITGLQVTWLRQTKRVPNFKKA